MHLVFIASYTPATSKCISCSYYFPHGQSNEIALRLPAVVPLSLALVSLGSTTNSTDELALLSFKSMVSSSPPSLLGSWNSSSHFCSWPGVVCGHRHPDRVVALSLGSFNLSGRISPSLGNLSFLTELNLADNQFVGGIPGELGHLARLQLLNVTRNYLQGSIPVTLGGCTKLKVLDLSANRLQGEIPWTLNSLPAIEYLYLYKNRLSGDIPPSLGNLSNLQQLELHENILS